jgi:hypothetical protein
MFHLGKQLTTTSGRKTPITFGVKLQVVTAMLLHCLIVECPTKNGVQPRPSGTVVSGIWLSMN